MTTITSENVKFNGTLSNAAVLKNASGVKTLILTDALSAGDRAILDAFIAQYGSNPLSAPTAGYKKVNYASTTTGSTATGFSNVSSATAGTATINVGGNKSSGTASGLSATVGTSGKQSVILNAAVTGSSATGLNGASTASGRQSYTWTGLVGASASGLANNSTVYTASVVIDGVTKNISITGSAAQTFTLVISAINTALGSAGTASIQSSTELRITSATTGPTSTVAITDTNLFSSMTGVGTKQAAVAGTTATTYTVAMTIDGVSTPLSIPGASAQTYTTLISAINTGLSTAGSAALVGSDIVFTSASAGLTSKVRLNSSTLFPALTAYQGIAVPQDGDSTGKRYDATIVIDGAIKTVNFAGASGTTFGAVVTAINTAIGAAGTAAITGGNIVITSATTGVNSSVVIYDNGFLCSSLTGFTGVTYVAGTAPTNYTATITIDGVAKPVSLQGSAAQTFTTLVSGINTAIGAAGTAALSGGVITITSATTGTSSTVTISDGGLFKNAATFVSISPEVRGEADLVAAMQAKRVGSASLYDEFKVISVGSKPALPAVPAALPKTLTFTYWNGSVWKYLVDDTNV